MGHPEIVLLFGRICSGKGTYMKKSRTSARVVVSDIVKSLIKGTDRSSLQDTLYLEAKIASTILDVTEDLVAEAVWETIIVDGIRQASIVDIVLKRWPKATLIWLDTSTEERRRRYNNRADRRDTESFEVADNRPIELECQKIFELYKSKLIIINN